MPTVKKERIEYSEGGTTFEAYCAFDAAVEGTRPCVLVAHDWSGCLEGACSVADRLAELGYVGFALDVYGKGVRGDPAGDNSALMGPLLGDRALLKRRLLAGLATASAHKLTDKSRIAAIGYCFGGLCVLDLARGATPGLKGVVSFHGIFAPPSLGAQQPIKAKLLVLHGWDDPFAPPNDVLGLAREMTEARADWQLHAYGHTKHAFTAEGANMPERGIVYQADAARRSWAAMQYFLREVFA